MHNGWFEDFAVGRVFHTPGKTLSEAEILEWAFAYDPQPFHMDKVAAERSVFGGLIETWQRLAARHDCLSPVHGASSLCPGGESRLSGGGRDPMAGPGPAG